MAETDNNIRAMEVFWTDDDPNDNMNGLVCAPGLLDRGDRQPPLPQVTQAKKSKLSKSDPGKKLQTTAKSHLKKKCETVKPTKVSKSDEEVVTKQSKRASLKDLCADDKRRVANLIRELARSGEEKESIVHQLQAERQHFDKQLQMLVGQQEKLLGEREDIQHQLLECQNILAHYQKSEDHIRRQLFEHKKSPGKENQGNNRKVEESYPLRKSYSEEVDLNKFATPPRQNTNFNSRLCQKMEANLREKQLVEAHAQANLGRRKRGEVHQNNVMHKRLSDAQVQTTFANEQTGNDDECKNMPPGGPSPERPFTHMIDRLIAKEKDAAVSAKYDLHHQGGQPQDQNHGPHAEHRLHEMDPLVQPVLSSTQRSMQSLPSTIPFVSSQVSNFDVMHPDLRPRSPSEASSDNTTGLADRFAKTLEYANRMQNNKVNTGSATLCETSSKDSSSQSGHQTSLNKQKAQLAKQKESLVKEQQRLRSILNEQEGLLRMKQEQLYQQQELQRARLQYFEETGQFPPKDKFPVSHGGDGVASTEMELTREASCHGFHNQHTHQSPTLGGQQMAAGDGFNMPLPATHHEHVELVSHYDNGGPYYQLKSDYDLYPQEAEEERLMDGLQNLGFVDQLGEEEEDVVPGWTSPIPGLKDDPRHVPPLDLGYEKTRSPRTISRHSVYDDTHQGNACIRNSSRKSAREDKMVDLLSIVDEVESIHSDYRSPKSMSKVEPQEDEEESGEEQESQMLEDVFFIR